MIRDDFKEKAIKYIKDNKRRKIVTTTTSTQKPVLVYTTHKNMTQASTDRADV